MMTVMISGWTLNPSDPRAPSEEQWAAMTDEQRERVVASLPVDPDPSWRAMGEGDRHYDNASVVRESLRRWFSGGGDELTSASTRRSTIPQSTTMNRMSSLYWTPSPGPG